MNANQIKILSESPFSDQLIELQDNSGRQQSQLQEEMNLNMLEEQEQAIRQLEVCSLIPLFFQNPFNLYWLTCVVTKSRNCNLINCDLGFQISKAWDLVLDNLEHNYKQHPGPNITSPANMATVICAETRESVAIPPQAQSHQCVTHTTLTSD